MTKEHIRIRMYRIGFGDCFLLSFPANGAANHHMLIDCGVHPTGTPGKSHIQRVVDDIESETSGKLAIIAASHAHADHVSGFSQCLESFNRFEIKEIWLPWADDPTNEHAKKLGRGQWNLVQMLDRHFAKRADRGLSGIAHARRQAAKEAVANLKQTEPSMNALRSGFASQVQPTYLRASDSISSPGGINGLHVEVLVPPPEQDEAFLKRMDPPKADEFLRIDDPGDPDYNAIKPFGSWWRKEVRDVQRDELFANLRLSSRERAEVKAVLTEQSFDALAMNLDDVRNNTSLVLLLRFRGKTLLFPGDAQYGNWRWWLDKPDARQILDEIDFLKVAHHGSHNASPKSAIEQMRKGIDVMVSTQNVPFPSIPRAKLLDALKIRSNKRMVRSDSIVVPGVPNAPKGPRMTDLPSRVRQGAFWYDLSIPI